LNIIIRENFVAFNKSAKAHKDDKKKRKKSKQRKQYSLLFAQYDENILDKNKYMRRERSDLSASIGNKEK
jgi:hypothetical protein